MENKYFTPSIEDIRVGYECEVDTHGTFGWVKVMVADYHFKTKVPKGYFGIGIFNLSEKFKQDNEIRVPYLTKEQIEAEGWVYKGIEHYNIMGCSVNQQFHNAMEKNEYVIQGRSLFGSQHHLKIFDISDQEGGHCIYEGLCKDINTFRYICKLLGI